MSGILSTSAISFFMCGSNISSSSGTTISVMNESYTTSCCYKDNCNAADDLKPKNGVSGCNYGLSSGGESASVLIPTSWVPHSTHK